MSRSIQQLPNNSGTTSVTEVYTSTGFNAGDPVYFQNGDYKNPANLTTPSSVNFTFPETAAVNPNGVGGIVAPSFTFTQMQTGIAGGTARQFADVLTSGNIVQVWTNHSVSPINTNEVYFRIINPSGTVLVGPTSVSSTFTNANYSAVSVVALVGGGFAVGWINNAGGTANSVNYAVYDNTGLVVTAATQDTSFALGASYLPIMMTSLANGGFAIAGKNTSLVIYLRAYSSTGVGAYTAITTGITASTAENSFALTARSDSTVFVCDRTSATQYRYELYSSTGTNLVSATFAVTSISGGGGGIGGPSASVQTNGTTIVIAFYTGNGTVGYPAFRFLPTGNSLSAQTIAIPVANTFFQVNYAGSYISVKCLSSNNFILYFADGYGNMQYAFYNSSGTCVSGSNNVGAIPLQVTGGFCGRYSQVTLLESSGFVYAYWTSATNQQKPVQQVFCKINTSTYLISPFSSVTGTPYTVTGVPAGASIPSTVNPNSLSFYSTTSSTSVSTNAPATVSGPTVINSALSVDAIASCTLPNGNFVVAYRINSGAYTVFASVYSPAGSLITTVTVGNGSSGEVYSVKVAALSSGGFVVVHTSTSTALARFQVYNSGYAPTYSTTLTIYSFDLAYNFDIAGLQDDNFVFVVDSDGSNSYAYIYNSSLTVLNQLSLPGMNKSFAVAANSWGGFGVAGWYEAGGSGYWATYVPTAVNTWTNVTSSTFTMTAYVQNPQLCATESGMYIFTRYTGTYPSYNMFVDSGSTSVTLVSSLSSWPLGSGNNPTSYPMMGIGLTGNGNVVIATSYDSTNIGVACLPAQMTFSNGQGLPYQSGATLSVTMFSNNYYSFSPSNGLASQPRVTAGAGNNCIITYISASSRPTFAIVNGTSVSNIFPIVAGVTPSALTPIAPVATSGVISGAFAGVAITSATAGSTGQLATNGQALLGASYTSTATGAFDSTGGAVSGLKGTFNGRSVNLQGNS